MAVAADRQADARGALAERLHRGAGEHTGAESEPSSRLANLVAVGQRGAAAATTAWQAEELASQSTRSKAARGEPSQSLAGLHGVTWAVDPALLANVKALTTCRSRDPGLAQAATAWLASVGTATADQPLFAMPYGDPNVVALIQQNHQEDVKNGYRLGRDVTKRILRRDVSPSASQPADASAQTAAIAWLPDGTAAYATIENLARYQIQVRTVVLSRSALPNAPDTVVRTPNGSGRSSTLLLTNDSLDALLSSAGPAPGSVFAASQDFLAQTALVAAEQPRRPADCGRAASPLGSAIEPGRRRARRDGFGTVAEPGQPDGPGWHEAPPPTSPCPRAAQVGPSIRRRNSAV